jgi:hypothetical protein
MDTVHVGCKGSKTGSDTLSFTVQPYGAAPIAVPWWLIGLGVGAAAIVIVAAVAARKT